MLSALEAQPRRTIDDVDDDTVVALAEPAPAPTPPMREATLTPEARAFNLRLESLLRRSATGDRAAFAQYYRETSARVAAFVRSRMGNEDDVHEVVNDVFTLAWRFAHKYDATRLDPISWMIMMARSRVVDRLRRHGTAHGAMEALRVAQPEADAIVTGPAEVVDREAARALLMRAADVLTPRSSRAVRLSVVEGRTHPEIAAETSEPLGTVKTRIRRALIHIREQLSQVLGHAR